MIEQAVFLGHHAHLMADHFRRIGFFEERRYGIGHNKKNLRNLLAGDCDNLYERKRQFDLVDRKFYERNRDLFVSVRDLCKQVGVGMQVGQRVDELVYALEQNGLAVGVIPHRASFLLKGDVLRWQQRQAFSPNPSETSGS